MAAMFNDGLIGTLIGLVASLIIGGFLGGRLWAQQSGPAATDETESNQVSPPIAGSAGDRPHGERDPWDDAADLTPRVGIHRRRPGD